MGKASRLKRERKVRKIPITPEMRAALDDQLKMFRAKFGREPGPDDPLFFDPDADTPQPLDLDKLKAQSIRAMTLAGIEPAKIYAHEKTGLLPSTETWDLLSAEDQDAWSQAMEEYESKIAKSKVN